MTQPIQSRRAKRQMLTAAVQIVGPSGSGKTLGALLIAYGMMKEKYPEADADFLWSKIGLIDTEHERSLIYEGMYYNGVTIGEFMFVNLTAPYSLERYVQAAQILIQQDGVEVLIVDSTSHAWEGEGGVMDYQNKLGGRFQDWNRANKEAYNPLVALLTGEMFGVHTISTSRAKQEYAMEPDEVGKQQIKKLGLKPVQRDTLEYEMQIVFRLDMDHTFETSKDNSSLFEGKKELLGPDHGKALFQWLEKGVDIHAERREQAAKEEQERQHIITEIRDFAAGYELTDWVEQMEKHPKVGPMDKASLAVLRNFRKGLQTKMEEKDKLNATEAPDVAQAN